MSRSVEIKIFSLFFLSLFVVLVEGSVAHSTENLFSPMRADAARQYAAILEECSRAGKERVQFFRAFDGLWPVPSNFVLIDTKNQQLEYNDLAFPWDNVYSKSAVYFGPKDLIETRWSAVFARRGQLVAKECSLEMKKFDATEEFGGPVVVVFGKYDRLLLAGPIAEVASSALACYVLTVPRIGRSCN